MSARLKPPPAGQSASARYEQLVELAPDGILVHADGLIVLANAAMIRLAGATSLDQVLGTRIESLLDPPYLKAAQDHLADGNGLADYSQPVRDLLHQLDGVDRPVEVRAVAFLDRGVPSAHLIVRDITDRLATEGARREMDEHLRQAQRMEAVGAIAGGVAHEVNNMLQVMLGFSGLLLTNPLLPRECVADMRQVVQAGRRAGAITAQLLAYGRRAPHHPCRVSLTEAIGETESLLRQALLPGQKLEIHGSDPSYALIDTGQLKQVVLNLVLNAAAAMPAHGTVSITCGPITVPAPMAAAEGSTIPPGEYVALQVRDAGIGIDTVTLARIFEPFFTTKASGEGTGLGLAAVLGIVQQHSGYITVRSEPGNGATFTVYLPIPPTETRFTPTPAMPARIDPPSPDHNLVLVVDDEPAIRILAARILEGAGYRVLQAREGMEALELITKHGRPALVLTDVIMPGVDGAELADRLLLRWPGLPVLFMSGYSTEALQQLMNLGTAGVLLQKPFTAEELLHSVAGALPTR